MPSVDKIQRGQQLLGIPSRPWNRFVDATDRVLDLDGPPSPTNRRSSGTSVTIKNGSGSNVEAMDILAIDGLEIEPTDLVSGSLNRYDLYSNLMLSGAKPNTTTPTPAFAHIGRFAICLEDIPNGETGQALIEGITWAKLTEDYADHPYADIAHDSFTLTSNWYGAAEILYSQTADSTKWALVRLGNFQAPVYKAKVDGVAITAGSSGTVQLWYKGVVTNPEQTVTAYFDWMEGADDTGDNDECLIRYFRDEKRWQIIEIACA